MRSVDPVTDVVLRFIETDTVLRERKVIEGGPVLLEVEESDAPVVEASPVQGLVVQCLCVSDGFFGGQVHFVPVAECKRHFDFA